VSDVDVMCQCCATDGQLESAAEKGIGIADRPHAILQGQDCCGLAIVLCSALLMVEAIDWIELLVI
jgi:hypothetical protein